MFFYIFSWCRIPRYRNESLAIWGQRGQYLPFLKLFHLSLGRRIANRIFKKAVFHRIWRFLFGNLVSFCFLICRGHPELANALCSLIIPWPDNCRNDAVLHIWRLSQDVFGVNGGDFSIKRFRKQKITKKRVWTLATKEAICHRSFWQWPMGSLDQLNRWSRALVHQWLGFDPS